MPPPILQANGPRGISMRFLKGRSRVKNQYLQAAMYKAMEAQGDARPLCWPGATVRATFYHAKKARRDADNAIASLKSAMDGIVKSGALRDDQRCTWLPVVFLIDAARPRVVLELRRSEG